MQKLRGFADNGACPIDPTGGKRKEDDHFGSSSYCFKDSATMSFWM